jgi:hypothetical protein
MGKITFKPFEYSLYTYQNNYITKTIMNTEPIDQLFEAIKNEEYELAQEIIKYFAGLK